MPDGHTSFFALTKPEIGASVDTWGQKLNDNADLIDLLLQMVCPVGTIHEFAGATAPPGWLLCDGSLLAIADYPKLFAVLGSAYGGDGATTFALPDRRGRIGMAAGSGTDQDGRTYSIGFRARAGRIAQQLTLLQLPAVTLSIAAGGDHSHQGWTDAQGAHNHAGWADPAGSGHNHITSPGGDHGHVFSIPALDHLSGTGGGVVTHSGTGAFAGYSTSTGGAHQHDMATFGEHAHNVAVGWGGVHQHNVGTAVGGAHTHAASLPGGNQPFDLLTPYLGHHYIIFAGYEPGLSMMMLLLEGEGGGVGAAVTPRLASAVRPALASPLRGG